MATAPGAAWGVGGAKHGARPSHPRGEWWQERQELAARQEADQVRLAAFYEKQDREREEREAAEWEARWATAR